MKLRAYQTQAIERLRELLRKGMRRLLLVAPTGSGKTVIAAALITSALARGRSVLFLAHRRELIKQAWCKLVRSGVDPTQIGIILPRIGYPRESTIPLGGYDALSDDELWDRYAARNPGAPVQVASIQTLVRREIPQADIVMIDEAHRSRAASYEKVVDTVKEPIVVGLTATPIRTDGKCLGRSYEELVVVSQYRELVDQGHLVAPRVWSTPEEARPNLEGVRVKGSDYDIVELGQACNLDGLVGGIVEHYQRHGNDAPAFAFAAGIEHSKAIADKFNAAGIVAAHLDGSTPPEDRTRILRELGEGKIRVVSNCDVCTEGTDVPAVKTIILARPTKSLRVYLQMVGRGSRPHASGLPFVVLDHAGCAITHGLPQDDREWTLKRKRKRRGEEREAVRECKQCWAVLPLGTRVCPECGFEFPPPEPKTLREIAGELREIRRPETYEERKHIFELVCEQWRLENERRDSPMAPGWIAHRFRDIAGTWPNGFRLPELTAEQAAIRRRFDELKRYEEQHAMPAGWARSQLKQELGSHAA